jgi:hypothetical protein
MNQAVVLYTVGDRSYPFVAIRECELRLEALEAAEQEAAATGPSLPNSASANATYAALS